MVWSPESRARSLAKRSDRRAWPKGTLETLISEVPEEQMRTVLWAMMGMIRLLEMQVEILAGNPVAVFKELDPDEGL